MLRKVQVILNFGSYFIPENSHVNWGVFTWGWP